MLSLMLGAQAHTVQGGTVLPYRQGNLSISVPLLEAPLNLQLLDGDNDQQYHLYWNAVAGATRYDVTRRTEDGVLVNVATNLPALVAPVGAEPALGFQFRVRACNASVCGKWSDIERHASPGSMELSGTSLSGGVTVSITGTYTVAWSAVTGAVLRYELQERFGTGAWSMLHNAASIGVNRAAMADGNYQYRVRACYAAGCGAYASAELIVARPPAAPAAPTVPGFNNSGVFSVSWNSVAGADRYQLDRSADGVNWTQIVEEFTTSHAEAGLGSATYRYRVRACNIGGCSANSPVATTTVLLPPAAPTLTVPSFIASGGYTVSWTSSATAASYQLDRSIDGVTWANIQTDSTLTKIESGLANGTYYYRVSACNAGGCGPYASAIALLGVAPSAPTQLSGPSLNDSGIYAISWNGAPGAARYELDERVGNGAWTAIHDGTATNANLTGRAPDTYQYRVRACNGAGCSGNTAAISVRVIAPVVVGQSPIPLSSIDLSLPDILASDTIGSMAGDFRVDETGAATYKVPIFAVPGTAGVTPNIALSYSSQAGNGLLGRGWSLDGLSAVVRCRQTRHQDGMAKAITFTHEDRFCLDGQRLVLAPGSPAAYGYPNAIYRTEIDTYIKVTAVGGSIGDPDYFQVEKKDGSIWHYGSVPGGAYNDAKLRNAAGRTFQWAVKRLQDSVGNPQWFVYANDAAGQRIIEIRYAYGTNTGPGNEGARLIFNYEERPDELHSYVAGMAIKTTKRLKSVDVGNGGQIVRTYHLRYQESATASYTGPSHLVAIRECFQIFCLPDTNFTWIDNAGEVGFLGVNTTGLNSAGRERVATRHAFGDINGDGCLDLVWIDQTTAAFDNYAHWDGGLRYSLSSCDGGFVPTTFTNGQLQIDFNVKGMRLLLQDFNNDGRTDILVASSGAAKLMVHLSTPQADGSWKISAVGLDSGAPNSAGYKPADLNADGLVDILRFSQGAIRLSHRLQVRDANDIASPNFYVFGAEESWSGISYMVDGGPRDAVGQDLNGDGTPDYISSYVAGVRFPSEFWLLKPGNIIQKYSETYCALNSALQACPKAAADQVEMIDLNGDGLSDIIFSNMLSTNAAPQQTYFAINNGLDFGDEVLIGSDITNAVLNEYTWLKTRYQIDFNHDGYTDLAWNDVNAGKLRFRLWNAKTQSFDPKLDYFIGTTPGNKTDAHMFQDVNGDGIADYVAIWGSHGDQITVRLGRGPDQPRHVITEITNGLGAKTSITYGNLLKSSHYDRMRVGSTIEARTCTVPAFSLPGGGGGGGFSYPCPYARPNIGAFYTALNGPWELPEGTETLGKDPAAPVMEWAAPVYVVTRVASSAPAVPSNSTSLSEVVNNAVSAISYYYAEAKIQAGGRGLLGFHQLITVDEQTQVRTATTYRHDFPFIGYPLRTEVFKKDAAGNDKLISSAENTWGFQNWGDQHNVPPYRPVLKISTERTFDPNGGGSESVQLSVLQTRSTYDKYGNVLTILANVHRGGDEGVVSSKLTTNTYGTEEEKAKGRLISTVVDHARPNMAHLQRTSKFSYYCMGAAASVCPPGLKGLLYQESIEPDKPTVRMTTTHEYDRFGNRSRSVVGTNQLGELPCENNEAETCRETRWEYDTRLLDDSSAAVALGRFKDKTINAAGHVVESVQARNMLGQPLEVQGLNGAKTSFRYGPLGRKFLEYANTGEYSVSLRYTTADVCPNGAGGSAFSAFADVTRKAGGAQGAVCYDRLARPVRSSQTGFDGENILVDTQYDNLGRVKHVSEPYYQGSGSIPFTTRTYDELGRVEAIRHPDGKQSTTAYDGLTTTITDANNHSRIETKSPIGELAQVEDHLGGTVSFIYHADGNLHQTIVAGSNRAAGVPASMTTTLLYDERGRKRAMSDPNKGQWSYAYNAFGDLLKQVDGKGQATFMAYDRLGRMTSRIDCLIDDASCGSTNLKGDTRWTYDTASHGLGQLAEVVDRVSGYAKVLEYDEWGRVKATGIGLPSDEDYFQRVTYDQYGRVYRQFDAGGLFSGIENIYNGFGYLWKVVDALNTASEHYRVLGMDARGNVTQELNGAVTTTRTYAPLTGRLQRIESAVVQLNKVQDLNYVYDDVGNLTSRRDALRDITETFGYDELDRLTYQQAGANAAAAVEYDSFGNIRSKTGVGTYSYGANGAGPQAVTAVTGASPATYLYDANGNNTSGDGRTLKYTTFDKPYEIVKGSHKTEFAYDVDRAYYKRVDTSGGQVTTTVYIGNVERVSKPDGSLEVRRYVPGNGLITTTYASGGAQQGSINQTLLKDHLGSIDVIIQNGAVVGNPQNMSFDAWGLRRNVATAGWAPFTTAQLLGFDHSRTNKGFTGHEMLDEVGIIHMNGRIYDPKLGRFLQADSVVQAPSNLQAYNRYSYALNNPLGYTDPSGHFFLPLLAGALAVVGGATAIEIGVVVAFASFAQSMVMGAKFLEALKGAAIAGSSAWAFSSIGSADLTALASGATAAEVLRVAAFGVVGGISSILNGGKFGHGFVSAALGSTIAYVPGLQGASLGARAGRVLAGAVVGGTSSKITGGKFANGAVSAAFASVLGNMSQRDSRYRDYGGYDGLADTTSPNAVADVETMTVYGEHVNPGTSLITSLRMNKTTRLNLGVTFDAMLGPLGLSIKPIALTTDLRKVCAVSEVCLKVGAGAYIGASASGGAAISEHITTVNKNQESVELFWDGGKGLSTGGELLINKGKAEYEHHMGAGIGGQAGIKFCSTHTYACR